MSNEVSQDIRGVLIAVTGARVLLPNATVAEVITYSPPDPIEGAPAWMLGRIRWRGWRPAGDFLCTHDRFGRKRR